MYKYKDNVCDFMVSQAYVKGREAIPFTTSNHFEMQSLHLTALFNVCIYKDIERV